MKNSDITIERKGSTLCLKSKVKEQQTNQLLKELMEKDELAKIKKAAEGIDFENRCKYFMTVIGDARRVDLSANNKRHMLKAMIDRCVRTKGLTDP